MFYLLTESFAAQQQQVVDTILKACTVEKIYFLGSTLLSRRTESIFMPDAPNCRYAGHYYFLVTISNEREHNEVQNTIENICFNIIPVTAVVLSEERFKAWLSEGPLRKRYMQKLFYYTAKRIRFHCRLQQKMRQLYKKKRTVFIQQV